MILFLYLLEIYCIVLGIILLVAITKKRKLSWNNILGNIVLLFLLFRLKYKVVEHEIVFTGEYGDKDDWGQGLANVATTFLNLGIVYLITLVVQILFFIFFFKDFRKLNGNTTGRIDEK